VAVGGAWLSRRHYRRKRIDPQNFRVASPIAAALDVLIGLFHAATGAFGTAD